MYQTHSEVRTLIREQRKGARPAEVCINVGANSRDAQRIVVRVDELDDLIYGLKKVRALYEEEGLLAKD